MIKINKNKCDLCGSCVAVCPMDSIEMFETYLKINKNCNECMICVHICPVEALTKEDSDRSNV